MFPVSFANSQNGFFGDPSLFRRNSFAVSSCRRSLVFLIGTASASGRCSAFAHLTGPHPDIALLFRCQYPGAWLSVDRLDTALGAVVKKP